MVGKVVFKQFKQIISNTKTLKFIDNTFVPYTVKGFTNITKYDPYIFLLIQYFTEYMIKVCKLIHRGVVLPES